MPEPWSAIRTRSAGPAGGSPTAARAHPPPAAGARRRGPRPERAHLEPPAVGIACEALTIEVEEDLLELLAVAPGRRQGGSSATRGLTLAFFSSYSTRPSVSSSTRLTSVAFISGFCGRANERMFCESRRMRCDSFWMMSA